LLRQENINNISLVYPPKKRRPLLFARAAYTNQIFPAAPPSLSPLSLLAPIAIKSKADRNKGGAKALTITASQIQFLSESKTHLAQPQSTMEHIQRIGRAS
jgi:hypothetical protein